MTSRKNQGIQQLNTLPRDPATRYAVAVHKKRIPAGPHVRAACDRHLLDLARPKRDGLVWDKAEVKHVIGFFRDVLRLNSGAHEGQPFELLPWQCFILGSLFGWKRENGTRRYRTAFIEAAKGCGKTPFCAGIGLYMLAADGEERAQVYAAAYNHDQAGVLFQNAVAMVEQSPALSDRLHMTGGMTKDQISYMETNSFFKPVSSERQGRGKSGPLPHCALLDEVHEHPTNATVEFLAAGVKHRQNPLTIMITNSGVDRNTVCWDYHLYSIDIATGMQENDSFFAYVCAMDEDDEPFNDETTWIKANPSLPSIPGYDYIRDQVTAAKGMPSKQSVVSRLNFCQWVDAVDSWLTADSWGAVQSSEKLNIDDYKHLPCYGGLDMSVSSDLTALTLLFETGLVFVKAGEDGEPDLPKMTYVAFTFFWMPGDKLIEIEARDNMSPRYQTWRDDGHLFAPSGKVIDYQHVAALINKLCLDIPNLIAVAYDRAKIELLQTELDELNATVPFVEHGQGFYKAKSTGLWMPGSIEATEAAISEDRIVIDPNPVLNWNVASAVTKASNVNPTDRYFLKRASSGRIDGAVSLVQAVGVANSDVTDRDAAVNDFLINPVRI